MDSEPTAAATVKTTGSKRKRTDGDDDDADDASAAAAKRSRTDGVGAASGDLDGGAADYDLASILYIMLAAYDIHLFKGIHASVGGAMQHLKTWSATAQFNPWLKSKAITRLTNGGISLKIVSTLPRNDLVACRAALPHYLNAYGVVGGFLLAERESVTLQAVLTAMQYAMGEYVNKFGGPAVLVSGFVDAMLALGAQATDAAATRAAAEAPSPAVPFTRDALPPSTCQLIRLCMILRAPFCLYDHHSNGSAAISLRMASLYDVGTMVAALKRMLE